MTAKLDQPLLKGGIVLAVSVGMMNVFGHAFGDWSAYALLLTAIGSGYWWWQKPATAPALPPRPTEIDTTVVQQALASVHEVINQLQAEVENPDAVATIVPPELLQLQAQFAQVTSQMQRQDLKLGVIGSKGSGKTVLIEAMRALESAWAPAVAEVTMAESVSFSGLTAEGLAAEATAVQQAIAADLILFVITGDITASELQILQQLASQKRTLLVFNKQDQYLPEERSMLLGRLQQQVQMVIPSEDVVAIAAAPNALKVRRHEADGSAKEWLEEQAPDLVSLTQRLTTIVRQERQQLVLSSTLANVMALRQRAKTALNEVRRTRAMPLVEQFQWIAAGTAFASPMPTVDLIATAAISVQMVLDLGAVYQQKFSLQQAQKVATTLGSLILKQGLVEVSTQAIGSLLKTNAVTYVAGGAVQAFSAAYLTRVAGLSLIEYFQTQEPNLTLTEASPLAIERFSQILQAVFQKNQQLTVLKTFVTQAVDRFAPQVQATATPAVLPAATSTPFVPENRPVLEHQKISVLEQNESSPSSPTQSAAP
jgi:uncharacterized protein (DUF697 family)/energy-coupling factor transporter ATP-binding protein EcfA2